MTTTQAATYSAEAALPAALKLRYKQLATADPEQRSYQVRVHRCVSWMQRAAEMDDQQPEARFIYLWIALNCLYSRWDEERNEPDRDSPSRRDWLARVCQLDPATLTACLRQHCGLVKKVLENAFLSQVFWRDPYNPKAKGWAAQDGKQLDRNLKDGQVGKVLAQAMDRLFVLRGQIIHGSSSGGSRLNRKTLNDCRRLLETLLPVLAWVFVERGSGEAWPGICYPPLNRVGALPTAGKAGVR